MTIRDPSDGRLHKRCLRPHKPRRRHRHKAVGRAPTGKRQRPNALRPKLHVRRAEKQRLVPITALAGAPLPDPLPPGKRLDRDFAGRLKRISAERHAAWPLVLAMLREKGSSGSSPAGSAQLGRVAGLAAADRHPGERLSALADYNWAVGLDGLVNGLSAEKRQLGERVLGDANINIYPGGFGDVQRQRVDVRVLVTVLYLARRFHTITVSCLISGHSLLTKSGHVSLHASGRAVDIAAVGGVPVLGHQQRGSIVERALRSVLMLPAELQPSELISLFALGGPSFALPDHADHMHVGF